VYVRVVCVCTNVAIPSGQPSYESVYDIGSDSEYLILLQCSERMPVRIERLPIILLLTESHIRFCSLVPNERQLSFVEAAGQSEFHLAQLLAHSFLFLAKQSMKGLALSNFYDLRVT
jgi:hypothetical protein